MEPDRGVSDLVTALAAIRRAGHDVHLILCGKAHPTSTFDQGWIDFRGMVPHSEMPYYLNAVDVLALPYRESPIMEMGASCKIAEYLMCQRPIVSTRTLNFVGNFPKQAAVLADRLCAPEDPDDLARAILKQFADPLVAPPPEDMEWKAIAAAALSAIHRSPVQ
jgi:glycosyltransferase involved in cell wall biosynthesis